MIKSHAEERVDMAMAWAAPQNLGFLFNIYTMAEASDFKFGKQLGFAIKPHPEKSVRGLWKLPYIWGSP